MNGFVPMRSCRCEDDEFDSEPETECGIVSVASNYLLQFDEKYVLNLYLSEFFKS